jgi:hypothetical protein
MGGDTSDADGCCVCPEVIRLSTNRVVSGRSNKDAGGEAVPLRLVLLNKEEVPVEDDDEEEADLATTTGGVWLGIANADVVVRKSFELARDRNVMGLCLVGMSLLILLGIR